MLEELWDIAETELKKSNEAPSFELILDLATKALIEDTMEPCVSTSPHTPLV